MSGAEAEAPAVPAHCVASHGSTNAELLGLIRQGNSELRARMQTDLEKLLSTRLATHQAELERKFEAKLIELQHSLQQEQAALVSRLNLLNPAVIMDTVLSPGRPGHLLEVPCGTDQLTQLHLLA